MDVMRLAAFSAAPMLVLALWGCGTTTIDQRPSQLDAGAERSLLSYGMVKKLLVAGKTSQSEVVKAFGAPNNMTYAPGGSELWIYDHVRTETTTAAASSRAGIGIGSGAGQGVIGAGLSGSSSSTVHSSSVRTLTVIIEFDRSGIVTSHSARVGGY